LIQKIGLWVLGQACRQLACWQKQFPSNPPLTMNVNVSVKQLADPHLVEQVRRILEETGIAPGTLKLELTESALMSEIQSAREILGNLRSLGVGLELDDFGTGYSSLSYLRALKFDSLKIPHSFVSKLGTDRKTRAIVETIINLAHALNMDVVAEGIETEKQLHLLEKMGCDLGQGFLFHKPLECAAAENLLANLLKDGLGVSFARNARTLGPAPVSVATRVH
jgi:EAL domain-containing protein (putative c-di-GMP-specific phosphodiesterase class I)